MTRIRQQRQTQILQAAEKLFAQQGFHQTSMDDLCQATQLSPGSLYRYYPSKDHLIRALVEAEQAESLELLRQLGDHDDIMVGLRSVLQQALASLEDRRRYALDAEITAEAFRNKSVAKMIEASYQSVIASLAQALKTAQQRNTIDPHLNPTQAAELIIALFDGLWWRQAIRPQRSPAHYARSLTLMIERFLRPTSTPIPRARKN